MEEILVYSADWCNPCKALKKALNDKGIKYTVVDVDDSSEIAKVNRIRGVPTTIISNNGVEITRIVGFDATTINKIQRVVI